MRLFLDQNLSAQIAGLLNGSAFDVVDTRSLGLQRADDEEIVDYAVHENRVIVSADTDFGAILAARSVQKPSFVLLRRTQGLSPEAIASMLASNLPAHEAELAAGAILVISDEVVRVRSAYHACVIERFARPVASSVTHRAGCLPWRPSAQSRHRREDLSSDCSGAEGVAAVH